MSRGALCSPITRIIAREEKSRHFGPEIGGGMIVTPDPHALRSKAILEHGETEGYGQDGDGQLTALLH